MVLKFASLLFCYLAVLLNTYVFVKVYGVIGHKEFKLTCSNLIVLMILSMGTILSNYYLEFPLKFLFSFSIIFISYVFYYRENIVFLLFKLFLIYMLLSLCDFIVSIVFLFFPITSVSDIGSVTILRGLCTILVSLLLLLIISFDSILGFFNKLLDYILKKFSYMFLFLSFFTLIVFLVLTNISASVFNILNFTVSTFLILFFLCLCVVMIFQYFKNKHNEEEQKSLLDLMNEYEKMLDNDRINRHEMLNNLITLKTYKNKSSNDYEVLLDEIIKSYQVKKSEFYSKLYKLPSGIKGIIYYKIANIKDRDINVELVISKEVKNNFENINSRVHFRVCKILGIIIDNAFEAASESTEKYVLIDIYLEDGNIIIYIENSFKNNIDLDSIFEKGNSSKGRNRGYGLFIANKLVKEKDDIVLEQSINNNIFVSILTIKNP